MLVCVKLAEFYANSILAAPDNFTGDGQWFLIAGSRKCHDDFLAAEESVAGFDKYPMIADIQYIPVKLATLNDVGQWYQTGFARVSTSVFADDSVNLGLQMLQQSSLMLIGHVDDQLE